MLLVAAFFPLFWAIGERSLWSSEGRWAEITREMLTSGDFFHPTIGGEPYFDKPLLTYWVIAAFSAVTGRLDELIIRLPSAFAAVVTLVCTMYLGQRLWLMAVFLTETRQEVSTKNEAPKTNLDCCSHFRSGVRAFSDRILMSKVGWELPSSLGRSFLIVGLAAVLTGAVAYKVSGTVLRNAELPTILVLILMAGILQCGFFVWQYNILESCRTERPFAIQMKKAIVSLPHERVAFWHRCEDKVLSYMKWVPPVTTLTDESALGAFLENDQPGVIISQGRYINEEVAALLPPQPTYMEDRHTWESPERYQKKLNAWFINPCLSQISMESMEANHAK